MKEWYDNTLLSRLNNKSTGCIIIVMQRLHQDDLVDHVLPQDDWTVLSSPAIAEEDERVPWDTASKTSDLNDYSVCTTWSVERDKYYLLNAIRRRLNYPDLKRAIVAHAKEYGSPTVVIEDKSSGTQLIQDLRNEGVLSVIDYKPPSGADVFTPAATGSRTAAFCLPASAPPLDDYITELVGFPGVKHDDQVASTTQALDDLREPDILAQFVRASDLNIM